MDTLRFVVYDKEDTFRRQLTPGSSDTVLIANGIPTAEFTVDDDDPSLDDLTADGARCGYWFRGVEWFRGRVDSIEGTGPIGDVSFRVTGDVRKLWDWQGWPEPDAPVTVQTEEYARYTGVSESVFKDALTENFTRLGVPWTTAADLARGSSTRVEFRFHPLAEKLIPVVDVDDLIVTIVYDDGDVIVDLRDAETVPGVLSLKTGVLEEYGWNLTAPTATRVVVGGAGEGVARDFILMVDTARETAWGDIIETFRDARMADDGADLSIDGAEALAGGSPTAGVSMQLVESDRFRFGDTFIHGDQVRVQVGPVDVLERITRVQITDTPNDGIVVTPHLGSIDDNPDAELGSQVAALARGVRDTGRR